MAIDQSQVDQILAGVSGSGEDSETRLHNLEQEVDYIKTSIKRLLIDIRERMNELENPFSMEIEDVTEQIKEEVIEQIKKSKIKISGAESPEEEKEREREDDRNRYQRQPDYGPAGLQLHLAPQPQYPPPGIVQVTPYPSYQQPQYQAPATAQQAPPESAAPAPASKESLIDETILRMLTEQAKQKEAEAPKIHEPALAVQAPAIHPKGKIELQKVQKLFEWTGKAVKKYGHDRLELMLDSYQALGYISGDAMEQVREIARLMPPSLGIEHEIDSGDFVSEIYALKIILEPEDTSLDRDMIEMLMSGSGSSAASPSNTIPAPQKARGRRASRDKDESQEWIDMLDRI